MKINRAMEGQHDGRRQHTQAENASCTRPNRCGAWHAKATRVFRVKVPIRTSEKRVGGAPPALCSGAAEPRHLAGLFSKIVHPHTPHGCSLRKRGPRGELFVLFVEKSGRGGPLPHSPTTQHVAIRRPDAHLKSGVARMERAPTRPSRRRGSSYRN